MIDDAIRPARRARKLLIWIGVPLAVVVALVVPRTFDAEPFDESGLQPAELPEVSDADNMIPEIVKVDALRWEPQEWIGLDFKPTATEPVNWETVAKFMRKNEGYFEALDPLLTRSQCVAPALENMFSSEPHVLPIRRAVEWMGVRRGWLCHEGRVTEAANSVFSLNRLTFGYLEHPTSITHFLTANALVLDTSIQAVETSFCDGVTSRDLETLSLLFTNNLELRDRFVESLKHEFQLCAGLVREAYEEASVWKRWFQFKQNKTVTLVGEGIEAAIRAVETDSHIPVDAPNLPAPNVARLALTGNVTGLNMQSLFPVYARMSDRAMAANVRRGILRTTLAVRRYEVDHGELPTELSALVPDYLPAEALTTEGREIAYDKVMRWVGIDKPESLEASKTPRIHYQVWKR